MRGAKAALLSLIAAWALVLSPAVVLAKTAKELQKGIAAYNDLEYEKAVKLLSVALKKKLAKKDQVEAYRYLALSYLALGKKDDARGAYKKLIEVDPTYQLPETESPVALELFAEEKGGGQKPEGAPAGGEKKPEENVVVEMPPDEVEKAPAKVYNPTIEASFEPADPQPGQTVAVVLTVLPADLTVDSLILKHRVQGQRGGWSNVKAELQGGGRWSALIPGTNVKGPAIEYYAMAFNEGGVKASSGSESSPQVLVVASEERGGAAGPPIYSKWWFWTAVGGVVLAGAAVGFFVATSGDEAETGFIDVTVMPPP